MKKERKETAKSRKKVCQQVPEVESNRILIDSFIWRLYYGEIVGCWTPISDKKNDKLCFSISCIGSCLDFLEIGRNLWLFDNFELFLRAF